MNNQRSHWEMRGSNKKIVQADLTFVPSQLSSWAENISTQVAREGDSFQMVGLNVISYVYVISFLAT